MSHAFRSWHTAMPYQCQRLGAALRAPGRALVSRHSWIHSGSSSPAGRLAEFSEDLLLADRLPFMDQTRGNVRPGIDLPVHHHPLFEVDGLGVKPDDPRFDCVLLPQLQGLAEGDGLPRGHGRPAPPTHLLPGSAACHQIKSAQVHEREIHAVIDVHGDIDIRGQHAKRQGGRVPDAQRRTARGREQEQEGSQKQVHAYMLPVSNIGAKGLHP